MKVNLKKAVVFILFTAAATGLMAQDNLKSERVGDMEVRWQVDDGNLYFEVSAPTSGWIAVGFNPEKKMKDADVIIGCVKEGGEVVIEDHFGTSMVSHTLDTELGGENQINDPEGSEENGVTTLKFVIPLDSGDAYDTVMVPGNTYTMIVAFGADDNMKQRHSFRDHIEFEL